MSSMARGKQVAVDLAGYPELVVIYLGMRVNTPRGLKTLLAFGPRIKASVGAQPDGLLLHQNIIWGMFPPHFGMRQYWRDFDSLERWARADPHASGGAGSSRTGEAQDSGTRPTSPEAVSRRATWTCPRTSGCPSSPPHVAKRGSMLSARRRLGLPGQETKASPLPEQAYATYITGPGERTAR